MALTTAQLRRLRKKARGGEWAAVTCEGCGWTGLDVHDFSDPDVTPCPECGHEYARYACDY